MRLATELYCLVGGDGYGRPPTVVGKTADANELKLGFLRIGIGEFFLRLFKEKTQCPTNALHCC